MGRISATVVPALLVAPLLVAEGGASPAQAALSPYWQSAREIAAIVEDGRVHDAIRYVEPILSVTTSGDDVYVVRTERCKVTVTIVDKPVDGMMVGPRQFDLEVGQAECE